MAIQGKNPSRFSPQLQQAFSSLTLTKRNATSLSRQQQLTQRKCASDISESEQKTFVDAVTKMINDASYAKLAEVHANMKHQMHSRHKEHSEHSKQPEWVFDPIGQQRFLPWHRAYLLRLEEELQRKNSSAFIPYLDWTQDTPEWVKKFKPDVTSASKKKTKLKNERTHPDSPYISTLSELNALLSNQTYGSFTKALEEGPHDRGHRLFGSLMAKFETAAYDPIFWMHHAAVDRIWAQWQARPPNQPPDLTGKHATMDPWPDTVASLHSISSLGYSYVETEPGAT